MPKIAGTCPTSMTLSKEMLVDIFATAKEADGIADGARVIGINMEGPFIAPEKKGAQNGAYIQAPSAETFRACQQASGGLIKLVTLAPEMEGSVEFIKELKDEVHISVGHTTADYDTAKAAFEAGADHVTHLYNALPPLNHRAPGVIGAAADNDHVYAELISDGMHIHGSAIRAAFRMFGPERIVLISDSMMACGMENGEYELGGQKVFMKDRKATLADGTLAGSSIHLMDGLRNAVSFGVPLEQAVMAATSAPAKAIGMEREIGCIRTGARADLLILDEHTAALDPKTADIIMELTNKVVQEKHLTAMMVTHNLRYAVEYGSRLIMMDKGHIVLDKAGEEKVNTKVDDILDIFTKISIECGN